jgi:hypothetical protein
MDSVNQREDCSRVAGMVDTSDAVNACANQAQAKEPSDPLPHICVVSKMVPEAVSAAIDAISARNEPPSLFYHAGELVMLNVQADALLYKLGTSELACELTYAARWFEETANGQRAIYPPALIVRAVLMRAAIWAPPLLGIVRNPVFGLNWELILTPGYHTADQVFYAPNHGVLCDVPQCPSEVQVQTAKQLLCDELLGDFPFLRNSDRAAAIAAMIVPFVRERLEGATPLHLIESPQPGSGKTLLADVIAVPALGEETSATTEIANGDDLRKSITSMALVGDPIFLIDNINAKLGGSALAAALTKIQWSDRIVGTSRQANVTFQPLWLATGNNVTVTPELARRVVRCRIDAGTANPHLRVGFRHANLLAWAKENRESLIHAILVLVRNWLAHGRPEGPIVLGSYESYCRIIGGILAAAGIDGFLADVQSDHLFLDDSSTEWSAFVAAWYEKFGTGHVGGEELDRELLTPNLEMLATTMATTSSPRGRRIKLGQELRRRRDAVIGGFRVRVSDHVDGHGCWHYWLENLSVPEEAAQPALPTTSMTT